MQFSFNKKCCTTSLVWSSVMVLNRGKEMVGVGGVASSFSSTLVSQDKNSHHWSESSSPKITNLPPLINAQFP